MSLEMSIISQVQLTETHKTWNIISITWSYSMKLQQPKIISVSHQVDKGHCPLKSTELQNCSCLTQPRICTQSHTE